MASRFLFQELLFGKKSVMSKRSLNSNHNHSCSFLSTNASFGLHKRALMREIDASLPQHALRIGGTADELNIKLARQQHEALTKAIQSTSADLIIHHLSSDGLPDSVFIEDTVIIVGQTAMITNPGAASRRAETFEVKLFLEETYEDIDVIQQTSGTLDGGDVLFTGYDRICMMT